MDEQTPQPIVAPVSTPQEPTPVAPAPAPAETGNKLPPIKELISNAWQLYKSRLKISILLQLIGLIPIIAMVVLVGGGIFASDALESTALLIVAIIILIPLIAVLILLTTSIQIAQIMLFDMPVEELGIKSLLKKAYPKFWRFVGLSILTSLIIIGGFTLFIIPGIILMVYISFGAYFAMLDDKKAMESIRLSREYVRGYWWAVFGRAMLLMLAIFVFYIVIGIISAILDLMGLSAVSSIISYGLNIILSPLYVALAFVLFKQLKANKGEVVLPATGTWKYVTLAVVGGLLIPLMIISSVTLLALNSARGKSRDAKRDADINQILGALDIYYTDNQKFPASLDELAKTYSMFSWSAPTPPDGTCTMEQNDYKYTLLDPQNFTLEFCLGSSSPAGDAGVNVIDTRKMEMAEPAPANDLPVNSSPVQTMPAL